MAVTTPTSNMWDMLANEQSYREMVLNKLNATEMPTVYDPIYNKLIMQISDTIYHKMRVEQRWYGIGSTHAPAMYPGILREIAMKRRKGMNFAMDQNPRPTQLDVYEIINDEIDVRYHATQFRWMYGWTIFDEELRRFSGGNGTTIGQLTEMKAAGAASSRNMFMDALRKKTLSVYATQVATQVPTDIDISNFETLTQDQAQAWLNKIDGLLHQLWAGTNLYNGLNQFMQTDKDRLQIIIPYQYYQNVMRRAFPDVYDRQPFEGILPRNMILIDTMGDDHVMTVGGDSQPVTPTFDAKGMNLLNWSTTSNIVANEDVQCVIMDSFALGFEDNLDQTLVGQKDIEKLATPVRMHYWTKAYITDMVQGLAVTRSGV